MAFTPGFESLGGTHERREALVAHQPVPCQHLPTITPHVVVAWEAKKEEEEEVKGDIPIRIDSSHRFPFLPHPLLISTIPSTKIKGCEGIVHWNQP